MKYETIIPVGARVRYHARFLRSTGQYTGEDAPCAFGPFARGELVAIPADGKHLAEVRWDNGEVRPVHPANLSHKIRDGLWSDVSEV